jgi:hypothetical protein
MYQRYLAHAPRHKFKFKNKLYSLDATVVSLCLRFSPGLLSGAPRRVSSSTPSWTTTATCLPLWPSPPPGSMR